MLKLGLGQSRLRALMFPGWGAGGAHGSRSGCPGPMAFRWTCWKQQFGESAAGAINQSVGPGQTVLSGFCFSYVKETKSLCFGLLKQNWALRSELLNQETGMHLLRIA